MNTDFHNLNEQETSQGLVFKKTLGSYSVRANGQVITCSISSKLRKELVFPIADPNSLRRRVVAVEEIRTVDPIAVGDSVHFVDAGEQTGMITEVLPRKNKLTRRDPGKKPLEQVIVSNVDQVIPIFSAAQPVPKWNLLDRYLATAEWAEIPARICITKLDLVEGSLEMVDLERELEYFERIGYPVIRTSVVAGKGISTLRDALRDRISVFIGKSGVGKTSLLNAVQPGLGLRVNNISQSTGKGKHTTTHLEMFSLDFGGGVVDTPGMREYTLGDLDGSDLALLFPEMRPLVGQCKFGLDCSHSHERGCAILDAVTSGEISERRYRSYRRILEG